MRRLAWLTCAVTVALSLPGLAQEATPTGPQLYTAQKCALCHAIAGKGNAKGPLDDVGGKLSPDDIRLWLTDAPAMTAKTKAPRKPEMKAYALTKPEVDTLVVYLAGLKTAK